MMRLVAVQRWPVVPKPPQSPPSMASSRFASSSTIIGFFPPSSSEQCLKLLAAMPPTMRPTAEDPVSEIARTSACCQWCAYVGAISGDDVDHAFRNAGISESANQVECGERRVLCRLDDAGIAANHGGQ